VRLEGEGRQALLQSVSDDPDKSYRIAGDRIEADRARGTAAVRAAPGTASRQRLERGPYVVEAQEVVLDERERAARASGEAVLAKVHASGAQAVVAEAQEALLRFALPASGTAAPLAATASAAIAGGAPLGLGAVAARLGRPETFVLSGPGGARVRLVPELLTASAEVPPPSERRPILLSARRIEGSFEAGADGRPALESVRAEGASGAPVTVAPAYDAPPAERFLLEAAGAVYDARRGEVRLTGERALLARGDERLTAPSVRFAVATLEGFLEGGVRGRLLAKLPGDVEEGFLDVASERARVRLARGGGGGEDAVAEMDAVGALRLSSPDGRTDARGDALYYRRDGRAGREVRLLGRPLEGRFGAQELSGEEMRFVLPPGWKPGGDPRRRDGAPGGSSRPKEKSP
jgi:hypothetical protein